MAPRRARLASNFDVVMACAAVLLLQSRIPQCAADKLSIVRAWYGGPKGHKGKVESIHASQPWLWQTGRRKGKIVTDIVKGYMRSDAALDFNPGRQACNDIFDFGHSWSCWKVLAIEYRYGEGPVKTWLSESVGHEPYSVYLPAEEGSPEEGSPDVPPEACNGRDSGCSNLQGGDGDCDSDDDCAGALKCGSDNCPRKSGGEGLGFMV